MISAIELKKYVADAGILGIIVDKLRHGKKPCLIILLEVDEGLEIGFHCAILPFGLTFHLWVEDGRESLLDVEEIT